MILLQPLLLILAALGGIALIVAYYLQRHQAPEVYFSATRFLPQSTPTRVIRSALPPLRLLVPILTLALITLSLSQPVVSQTQPAPLGIILDDSAFTTGDKGQATLRQIALAVADRVPANTQWGVFATSGATLADGTGRQDLVALLQSYSADSASTSYSPTIFQQAVSFLKERTGATPVLLLVGSTDTFLGYPGLDSLRTGLEKDGVKLIPVSSQSSSRPAFIAAMDLPHLSLLNSEARARIGVANTGKETISGELRLVDGNSVTVRTPVKLPAQSLSWQELKVTPKSSGLNKYDIAFSPNLPGAVDDKVAWELSAFTTQTVVVIASPANSNPGYMDKAFKSSPLVNTVTVIDPEALDVPKLRQALATTRVVVMDGVDAAQFPSELGTELRGWVESGGTLVFTCGPKVTETWNKHSLSAVLPAAFKLARNKQLQGVTVRDNAVTRNLEMESAPLMVTQYLSVDTPTAQQVLISVAGEPILIFKKANKGTVFLWASSSDPRWNNWAQHPSFPIFWSNILVYAISGDTPPISPQVDATRTLWRAAASNSGENVYYIDYKASPVVLPAPLQQALDQPVKAYRDYHILFLSLGLVVALGYAGWTVYGWRRARR